MRRIAIATAALLALVVAIAGLVLAARSQIKDAYAAPPPLAGYSDVGDAEAEALGQKVAQGFSSRDATAFDAALDVDALLRQMLADFPMTRRQRERFVDGARTGFAKATGGGLGRSMLQSFPPDTKAKLLRTRSRDGRREALLRLRLGEGVNYLGLILARDPKGTTRIVDWYNYLGGELGHVTLRASAEAMMGDLRQTPFERFAERFVRPPGAAEPDVGSTTLGIERVRKLLLAGSHQQALDAWKQLPEALRATRGGLMVRLTVAQGLSDAEYQLAIDEISARFPGDPTLELLLIDRYLLSKRPEAALRSIDLVDQSLGGDPYLAAMRTRPLLDLKRAPEARAVLRKAIADEPDLVDLWWAAISVELDQRDHAETARLLVEVEDTFQIEIADLTKIPEYEAFVRSPEHRDWLAARTKSVPSPGRPPSRVR